MTVDDPADDLLFAQLRSAAGALDPAPQDVVTGAIAAYAWRTLDAELAALTFDSAMESDALAGVRGGGARLLTFETPTATVEVEAQVVGSLRRLLGQLVPAQEAALDIQHRGGVQSVVTDARGRFTVDDLTPGPLSIRWRPQDPTTQPPIVTDWVLV